MRHIEGENIRIRRPRFYDPHLYWSWISQYWTSLLIGAAAGYLLGVML